MTFFPRPSPLPQTPALDAIALHLLRAIVSATKADRRTHLEELAEEIGVRKVDCRRALSTLHRQGYVDVLRMRPTFEGFALGAALHEATLRELRPTSVRPADHTELGRTELARAERSLADRAHRDSPRTSEPPPSSRAA